MALDGRMLLLAQLSLVATLLLATTTTPLPDCKESCGGISIPYPFGLSEECYLHMPAGKDPQQFKLACNTATSPPTLHFGDSKSYPSNISNILKEESALQVMMNISRNCYTGLFIDYTLSWAGNLYLPPSYTLAETNKIYNIGCNKATKMLGYTRNVTKRISPEMPYQVASSGVSLCQDEFGKNFPDTCTGFGCSVNYIPSGIQNATVDVWTLGTAFGNTSQWGEDYPCGYGFVVDERHFTFTTPETDLRDKLI